MVVLMAASLSCTEVIDIELDSTYSRLVVYGVITTDSAVHSVQLTKTTDYFFTQEPPVVSDAIVEVTFNDKTYLLEETSIRKGVYAFPTAFKGEIGTTYDLTINGVDIDEDGIEETYTASTTMPEIADPDSLTLQKFITPFFSGYQLAFWSPEVVGRNWYNFQLVKNSTNLNSRLSDYSVQPDDIAFDGYIKGFPVGFLDDEEEDEAVIPGDTITLKVSSITRQYYDFITQAQNEIFGNNPLFSGPPANVSTNLDNNAQGIFTAYSIRRISAYAPAFSQIP